MVVVTHPRTKNNHKELTVVRGEYLEVSNLFKSGFCEKLQQGTPHLC